jgi:hypothetical protein
MITIIAINDNTMNKFKYYEQIIAIIDNTIMNKDLLVFLERNRNYFIGF